MARRRRPSKHRLWFAIAFTFVLFATLEVAFRAAGVREAYRPEELGQWRFSANLRGKSFRGPRDGHSFVVSSNADGLRTSVPVARSSDLKRVAVMGDSTVFGWGVDDGFSVADGLHLGLDPATVEVMNAGQPGYSTTMVAWLFSEVVAKYKPDITVVFVPLHDSNLVLVSDRETLHGGRNPVAATRVWLALNSRTYQVLRTLVFRATDQAFLLPDQGTGEPRVPRVSDRERTLALDEMTQLAKGWGGTLAVGYLPFRADIELDEVRPRSTEAWMKSYSSENAIPFIDARDCCRGGQDLVLVDDPGHLSAAGNMKAASKIAQLLGPYVFASND